MFRISSSVTYSSTAILRKYVQKVNLLPRHYGMSESPHVLSFFFFMIVTERERERERGEREAETQAEGEAGSMHREPDVGSDPGSPGSRPGPKAGAKPLHHPGIPTCDS